MGILIFKERTARRLYKSFGAKGLMLSALAEAQLVQEIRISRVIARVIHCGPDVV
jgi:hypothetical protein